MTMQLTETAKVSPHSLKQAIRRYLSTPLTPSYDSRGLLARMLIDLLMLNAALFLGYVFAIVYHATINPAGVSAFWIHRLLLSGWLAHVPILTVSALIAFTASRIYSVKPRSRLRRKIAVSFQSVGLAYLLCICLAYPLSLVPLPISTVVPSLLLSLVMVTGARVGKTLFSKAYLVEPRLGTKAHKVEYVLVIGGAGYIGSTLVRQLLDAHYHVRVLDRLMFGDEAIRDLYTHPNFELVVGDFQNIEPIVRAVHGMDAVIHLGAIVGDPACALDRELTLSVNTHAVRMICAICCGYGVRRFLFASTCSVYGAQDGIIDEGSPLAPVSLYAQSKIEAEKAILDNKNEAFHPTILRLATAYGLSRRMRFDLVVNLLTARALAKGNITIYNGHQWRPFIQINDIARAFITCLEAPIAQVSRQVFNAGDNDANLTLRELGDMVAKLVPGTKVNHEENSSDPRSYHVDFSRIARDLGFRCLTRVEDGIEEMAVAVKKGTFAEYEAIAYNNAAHLKSNGKKLLMEPLFFQGPRVRVDEAVGKVNGPKSELLTGGEAPQQSSAVALPSTSMA